MPSASQPPTIDTTKAPSGSEHPGRPAVAVEGLTKAYGNLSVLRDLSFSVAQGEIFGILGSNGAGKTTTVEIVQGLRPADGGQIRVLGLDPVTERPRLRHLVGSQLQSSALPDRLRVGEALRLFARLAGDVVDWSTLSNEWGLDSLERRPFAALSGGQRQRLFLALALVNRPRLVFLDELTQGLDVSARLETWRLIERVRDEGATVVLVTHLMDEAERLCDQVGILHDGRIVASGGPADLVAKVAGPVHVRFTCSDPASLAGLERAPGVAEVADDQGLADIACTASSSVAVVAELHRRGLAPTDLSIVRPSLEDAFVALTDTKGDPR